jgi:hypothetical protein
MTLIQVTNGVVILQIVTFVVLCALLIATGAWRLGLAQGLLAIITWLVYWA